MAKKSEKPYRLMGGLNLRSKGDQMVRLWFPFLFGICDDRDWSAGLSLHSHRSRWRRSTDGSGKTRDHYRLRELVLALWIGDEQVELVCDVWGFLCRTGPPSLYFRRQLGADIQPTVDA